MRTILKELQITRQQVIDYCKKKYPHLFSKQEMIPLKEWKLDFKNTFATDVKKGIVIESCSVSFKCLLLMYLSDHNFKVTGQFASDLKGW